MMHSFSAIFRMFTHSIVIDLGNLLGIDLHSNFITGGKAKKDL